MKALIATAAAMGCLLALAAQGSLASSRVFPTYWPTAVPTVPATAPAPSGMSLITSMYAVANQMGSVHTVTTAQYEEPDIERTVMRTIGDSSSKTFRGRLTTTTQVIPLAPIESGYTYGGVERYVGHTQADRSAGGGTTGKWHCQSIPGNLSDSYFTVYEWRHIAEAKNLGAAMVDGQLTWHVTAFAIWRELKKHLTHYEPVDYYIAQSNHELVRELTDARGNGPEGLIPYAQVIDYSKWGEPVKVGLPATCRKDAHA